MIIISQDEKNILNFKSVEIIAVERVYEMYGIKAINNNGRNVLGVYKTEERAIEVLKEIIVSYRNWENLKAGQPSGECKPVYEMPE